jgi:Arm DNA-binding domain
VSPPAVSVESRRTHFRYPCPGGEIGRRKGLKIPRPQGRAGSSPAPGRLGTSERLRRSPYHGTKTLQITVFPDLLSPWLSVDGIARSGVDHRVAREPPKNIPHSTRRMPLLTEVRLRSAKPREKPYRLFDVLGLFLLVMPNADRHKGRLWRLRYHYGKSEKLLSLGSYPEVPLKRARENRDEARRLLADGVDPSAQRKITEESKAETFETIAREWLANAGEDHGCCHPAESAVVAGDALSSHQAPSFEPRSCATSDEMDSVTTTNKGSDPHARDEERRGLNAYPIASAILATDKSPLRSESAPYGALAVETHG